MKRKIYEELLEPLEHELVAMARWARVKGERICVLLEGRDTAGKGGTIKAISDRINPRQCRVVALPTAPWTVVDFNDQKHGRLTLIRNLLDRLPDFAVAEEG